MTYLKFRGIPFIERLPELGGTYNIISSEGDALSVAVFKDGCFELKPDHKRAVGQGLQLYWLEEFFDEEKKPTIVREGISFDAGTVNFSVNGKAYCTVADDVDVTFKKADTAPLDGTPIYSPILMPFRFMPYKDTSYQTKSGLLGRWQSVSQSGWWENSHVPPIEYCKIKDGINLPMLKRPIKAGQ